jgi:hypothetical protein
LLAKGEDFDSDVNAVSGRRRGQRQSGRGRMEARITRFNMP